MASWHGHRDDEDIPPVVQEVWAAKFKPGAGQASNVDACVLDPEGRLVRRWDAMAPRDGRGRGEDLRGDPIPRHWKENLAEARKALGLGDPGKPREVSLPALAEGLRSGIRVFTRLRDPGMPAYAAPVVELVPMGEEDWALLARPEKGASLEASALLPWLSAMYPGGVMERTDPDTKFAYRVTGAKGTLALEPAGEKDGAAFAFLHGRVTLTDSGGGDFSYSGELRVVIEYRDRKAASLKGVFEGRYPRQGPKGKGGFEFDLTGIFESVTR